MTKLRDALTPERTAAAVAAFLLALGVILIPAPAPAQALPNPLDMLPPGIPSLNPMDWAVEGYKALLEFMFGDIDTVAKGLINILLAVPLLTDERAFPELNRYREYVMGAGWGILGLTFVVACVRYWLSSYTGNGAFEALQGFIRTCGAVALLLVFPIVFDQLARAVNELTVALAVNPIVGNSLGEGLASTMSTYSLGGFAMIFGIAAVLLAIVLIVVKVIVIALLAVLFVASPLAIALWPLEETSWVMTSLFQAVLALLMFPVVWALCFGSFAMLNIDAMFPGTKADIVNTVLSPAISVAALVVAFRLPFKVLELGMQSGISPRLSSGVAHAQNVAAFVRR